MACIDRDIIIYHTETKKDYDALIDDLDKKGYMWQSFMPLKIRDYWGVYQEKTCIGVRSEGKNVFCSSFSTLIHSHEIYKYEAKEDTEIKIYHTETQADYDALMVELERQGCEWFSGRKPTEATTYWKLNSIETCVKIDKKVIAYNEKGYYAMIYPHVPIQKYKAKADEKMRFTKENVEVAINSYFDTFINTCPGRLIADIYAMYESDTVTEQRYTVVIADRYLVQLFIGRTDYRFVEFDELCAWKPSAFQLTEAEIKAIDERYWTFAVPVKEEAK